MAKSDNMYAKHYNKLKSAEEGEPINWATIYGESLGTRATTTLDARGQLSFVPT